jgi:hypothetical protein
MSIRQKIPQEYISQIHERTISLRFLDIIRRVFSLEVSVYTMFTLQTIFKPLLLRGSERELNPLVRGEKCTGEKQRRGRVHDVWWESREEKQCAAQKQIRVHGVWGEQRREETLLVRSRGKKMYMTCRGEQSREEVCCPEAEKST